MSRFGDPTADSSSFRRWDCGPDSTSFRRADWERSRR